MLIYIMLLIYFCLLFVKCLLISKIVLTLRKIKFMKIDYYSVELYALLLQVVSFYENRGVKIKAVLSKSRSRPLPEVRAVYSVLAIQKYKQRYSIPQILGQVNCDHSNYLWYRKMVTDLYEYDNEFYNIFNKIRFEVLQDDMKVNFLTMEDIH